MDSVSFATARDLFQRGLQQHGAGKLREAEASYRQSLQHLPDRPSTLTNLGAVLLQLGRPAEALPLLEQALRSEPDNAEALSHRALALAELGRGRRGADGFRCPAGRRSGHGCRAPPPRLVSGAIAQARRRTGRL
jgi:tetratricopeptide (TPR) repeat protein